MEWKPKIKLSFIGRLGEVRRGKKTKIYSGNTWPLNTDLCLKENGTGTPFPSSC